jgi:hypothetical protein
MSASGGKADIDWVVRVALPLRLLSWRVLVRHRDARLSAGGRLLRNSKSKIKNRFLVLHIFEPGLLRARAPRLSNVGVGSSFPTRQVSARGAGVY